MVSSVAGSNVAFVGVEVEFVRVAERESVRLWRLRGTVCVKGVLRWGEM